MSIQPSQAAKRIIDFLAFPEYSPYLIDETFENDTAVTIHFYDEHGIETDTFELTYNNLPLLRHYIKRELQDPLLQEFRKTNTCKLLLQHINEMFSDTDPPIEYLFGNLIYIQ